MDGREFVRQHDEILKVFGHDESELAPRLGELFERFVDARIQLALSGVATSLEGEDAPFLETARRRRKKAGS